jgi:hypothetical protein
MSFSTNPQMVFQCCPKENFALTEIEDGYVVAEMSLA